MDRKQIDLNSSSNSDSNQQNIDFINHLQNLMQNGHSVTFSTQRYRPVYDRIVLSDDDESNHEVIEFIEFIEVESSFEPSREVINVESSREIIDVESSQEVIEVQSSREVIEVQSSREVIEVQSNQQESYHSRFQDSYYNISYDPNREDTLQWNERRRQEEGSDESGFGSESFGSQSLSEEDESISQSMDLDDYNELYSQVDMNHLRELIVERMGQFPEMSSEMSQTNQVENNHVDVIEIHSEEEEEDTPQSKKTKMIKKAPKK